MTVVRMRALQAMPAPCCGKCGVGGKVKSLRLRLNFVVVQWQGQEVE